MVLESKRRPALALPSAILVAVTLLLGFTGCGDDDTPQVGPVEIHFSASSGEGPFQCGQVINGLGVSDTSLACTTSKQSTVETE